MFIECFVYLICQVVYQNPQKQTRNNSCHKIGLSADLPTLLLEQHQPGTIITEHLETAWVRALQALSCNK